MKTFVGVLAVVSIFLGSLIYLFSNNEAADIRRNPVEVCGVGFLAYCFNTKPELLRIANGCVYDIDNRICGNFSVGRRK